MNKQEIIELIKGTATATFILPGLGETTIPTIELKPMVESWEQQLTNGWIPVSERLPVSEDRVLICANRKFQDGNTIQIIAVAMYEDGTMHTEDSGFVWEDIDFEYCEETDDYIIPEGWWEQTMYCEEFSKVDDFVTHWMPLPEPYKEVSE